MTTEEDFQRMLDKNPEDHATRLVFADWLQDRGDPRAEGYRALGANGFHACDSLPASAHRRKQKWLPQKETCWFCGPFAESHWSLPRDWFDALGRRDGKEEWTRDYENRRAAEDAAALAVLKLSAERREELLSGKAVAA